MKALPRMKGTFEAPTQKDESYFAAKRKLNIVYLLARNKSVRGDYEARRELAK